ncbi:hypothetical protein ACTXT7_011963, partial [Hymenolepis weldensis]
TISNVYCSSMVFKNIFLTDACRQILRKVEESDNITLENITSEIHCDIVMSIPIEIGFRRHPKQKLRTKRLEKHKSDENEEGAIQRKLTALLKIYWIAAIPRSVGNLQWKY